MRAFASSKCFSFVSLLLIVCLVTMEGCATQAAIPQQISVVTIPDGADVTIGDIKGVSPMSATVPGGYSTPHTIQIFKDGYQPQTVGVQRGFRTSALIMDIFPGALLAFIPLIVDAITGDWYYVANSSYTVRLQPNAGQPLNSAPMERR